MFLWVARRLRRGPLRLRLTSPMNKPASTSTRFPWIAMMTFGFAVFALVTSEFLPTGMLPSMVDDLGVSTSQVGFLVTIWAGTVVLTAVPMSFVTRRFPRKNLLVIAVALFIVSNVLAATAVAYPMLVASRVVGGVGNGMFWMIATGYITTLLPARQRSRGFLFISAGANLAFIVGLPLGTALSAVANWRFAFVVMVGVTLVTAVLLAVFLQHVPNTLDDDNLPSRRLWRDPTFPLVGLTILVVFLVVAGSNVFYPYVTPFLIDVAGFDRVNVSVPLAAYGLGGVVGIFIAAWLGRRPEAISRNLVWAVLYMGAVLAAVNLVAGDPVLVAVGIGLWSMGFSIADPLYGQLVMEVASPRLRDFAGALRTTAWNLGIGGGSLIGGLLLIPFGVGILPFVGAAIVVIAAVVTLAVRRRERLLAK